MPVIVPAWSTLTNSTSMLWFAISAPILCKLLLAIEWRRLQTEIKIVGQKKPVFRLS
jgi:hypothetical protein